MKAKSFGADVATKDDQSIHCRVEIRFEDGSHVVPTDGQRTCMANTEKTFEGNNLKLGPFQFNICSYKYGYKKFKLWVFLSTKGENDELHDVCILKSPGFVIKSKKPIVRPGAKKNASQPVDNKRKRVESEEESLSESNTQEKNSPIVSSPPSVCLTSSPTISAPSPTHLLTSDGLLVNMEAITFLNESYRLEEQKKFLEQQIWQYTALLNTLNGPHYTNQLIGQEQTQDLCVAPSSPYFSFESSNKRVKMTSDQLLGWNDYVNKM